ncbi:MAG: hypothetical protein ACM3Q1_08560 [Bacteroidales bacterium]
MRKAIVLPLLTLAAGVFAAGGAMAQHQHHAAPAAPPQPAPQQSAAPAPLGGGFLWLADTPLGGRKPATPEAGGASRSVETAVADVGERAMNHADVKHLWLRQGAAPGQSAAVAVADAALPLRVVGIDGQPREVAPATDSAGYHAQVPVEEMGFYNAYLTRAAVVDGRLDAMVAKAEVLKGTCCKKGVDPAQEKPISDPGQPIELVRLHMPDEKLFTRLVSGDEVMFIVTSFGKPLAGATVTLTTQQGWSKTVISGADGRASFTLIRDYYPSWDKFWRLNKQTFLITAEAQAGAGEWQGQPFQTARLRTTLAGKYSPSPTDYRSYAFGLGISLGVAVFLGTAIYLYRRRRVRPFREVRFDEKA